jgi:hypothetical protein
LGWRDVPVWAVWPLRELTGGHNGEVADVA